MKVVAYSVAPFEKEYLARANQKKHDITLISNALDMNTAIYAVDKDAVLVSVNDDVSELVIEKLFAMGIRYIATRSLNTDHLDKAAADRFAIKLSNIPTFIAVPVQTKEMMQSNADQIIKNLDQWQLNKCVGKACVASKGCNGIKSGHHH
ncbi:lactate dehydrogenase [Mucilaginibacter sp. HMF5004]|uniref:lactate dehydrogenase n=1 Tax=Mucilaginibacter rivuli TaxID=2857527 RepID=UPI001C5D57E1|nr:lactate dehydrogenase [Mucilaginibacter rivuli]MBW4891019.1 lactate dehydrogenase [Mucilaginibacter rivuli]